ncbi:MAG: SRPBCC family protein [Pseudomonadota bacterium]
MRSDITLLRRVLLGNAAVSALCGTALILTPGRLTDLLLAAQVEVLGLSATSILLILGVLLILVALDVVFVATRRELSSLFVRLISALDWAWVGASVLMLLLARESFTAFGTATVALLAALTALFAIVQARLQRGLNNYPGVDVWREDGQLFVRATRTVDAPASRVWSVVSDHEGYADVADNLSKVEVMDGDGLGMVRRCHDTKGRSWAEKCVLWEDGRRYSFVVDTTAPDYPYPIAELRGTWGLEPGAEGTSIVMEFQLRPRQGILGNLLTRAMVGPFERTCDRLLTNWQNRILKTTRADYAHRHTSPVTAAAHP